MSYESKDASLSVIGISAGLLVFLLIASIGTSAWFYYERLHGAASWPTTGRQTSFRDGPNERLGILIDYAAVNRDAGEHLSQYRWVDRDTGVAQIPIERAMDLVAKGVNPQAAPKEPGQVP